jgi:hypothetical protein
LLQPRSRLNGAILRGFDLLAGGELLLGRVVHENAGDLDDADEAEEEVYGCEPGVVSPCPRITSKDTIQNLHGGESGWGRKGGVSEMGEHG